MGLFLPRIVNFNGLKTGDGTQWWIMTVIREVNAIYTRKPGEGRVMCTDFCL